MNLRTRGRGSKNPKILRTSYMETPLLRPFSLSRSTPLPERKRSSNESRPPTPPLRSENGRGGGSPPVESGARARLQTDLSYTDERPGRDFHATSDISNLGFPCASGR